MKDKDFQKIINNAWQSLQNLLNRLGIHPLVALIGIIILFIIPRLVIIGVIIYAAYRMYYNRSSKNKNQTLIRSKRGKRGGKGKGRR